MAQRENLKAINFDLITLELYKVFGDGNTSPAYAKIKRFMLKHGFHHKQYSGYVSNSRMSYADTYDLINDMKLALPWLSKCMQKLDITDYMAESDALEFVTDTAVQVDDIGIDNASLEL
jgi:virulence-associated protein VapD